MGKEVGRDVQHHFKLKRSLLHGAVMESLFRIPGALKVDSKKIQWTKAGKTQARTSGKRDVVYEYSPSNTQVGRKVRQMAQMCDQKSRSSGRGARHC